MVVLFVTITAGCKAGDKSSSEWGNAGVLAGQLWGGHSVHYRVTSMALFFGLDPSVIHFHSFEG
jgi:hypothetical protein